MKTNNFCLKNKNHGIEEIKNVDVNVLNTSDETRKAYQYHMDQFLEKHQNYEELNVESKWKILKDSIVYATTKTLRKKEQKHRNTVDTKEVNILYKKLVKCNNENEKLMVINKIKDKENEIHLKYMEKKSKEVLDHQRDNKIFFSIHSVHYHIL